LYPTAGLLAAGIDPAKESTQYAGGHPQSVQAINKGTCDVGFAYDDILDKDVPAGKVSGVTASDVKVVWKSGLIAGSPIAVRLNMEKSLVDAVRDIVLNKANKTAMVKAGRCTTEATCQIIEDSSWGFIKTTDSYYDGVRAVCESTKSTRCR
jgi:phosphonate transport system substrate-binding protein